MSCAHDVRIHGGGLAGLSLGIALAGRGINVRVFEKGSYPRHRVCGEFICGVDDRVLDHLRIRHLFEDAQELKTMSWWHVGKCIAEQELTIQAMGISRHLLDQRLAEELTGAGGGLEQGGRSSFDDARREGAVWAAGRPLVKGSPWIGLKCHLHDLELASDLEMHLGPGGYAGLSRIEGGKVNLCGLFRLDSRIQVRMPDLLHAYLERMGAGPLIRKIRMAQVDPESCCSIAGFVMGNQAIPEEVLCIGDSMRMIPPFTGNGMSMAFESAEIVVRELMPWCEGKVAWDVAVRRVRKQMDLRFRKRMLLAQGLHGPLLQPVIQKILSGSVAHRLLPVDWVFRQLRTGGP